ncbi:MAG: hypothetical protein A2Y94_02600 [Caldithrix sp. RBG_13_44_9]|nr:MAG: hypothetical protein A2Y94_02600 [Caldithrix sp. RBG_13_44_9]
MDSSFFSSSWFTWFILPLLIFLARVVDVSFGTLRIVFIAKGRRYIAPMLGFVEVLIWLLAIGQIIKNLNNVACYIAYAGGFATGNFVGIWIENKLALGTQVLRIITNRDSADLINNLKSKGYGITLLNAEGSQGPVKIIFTIIKRKNLPEVSELIKTYNPKAFYSVEDVRLAKEGIFPTAGSQPKSFSQFPWFKLDRKGK